jgi:hypothetical protein
LPDNDAADGVTGTVICFVVIPPQPAAVKVYTVVVAGLTLLVPPDLEILAMSLSMIADVALVMTPQVNVVELPAMIELGDAVNDAITGGPGHGVGEGGCGGGGLGGSGCEDGWVGVAVGAGVRVAVTAAVDPVASVTVVAAVDPIVGVTVVAAGSAVDVAVGGASATEGLTWMEMEAGSLEAPAALNARTVTVWVPEVAFQVWRIEKLSCGLGGVSLRVTAPSMSSSTRTTPVASPEVDWIGTSSPSWYELPLGGEEIMTVGLAPPVGLQPARTVAPAKSAKNGMRNDESMRSFKLILPTWEIYWQDSWTSQSPASPIRRRV